MKYFELLAITNYLCTFKKITSIYRISDNVFKIVFDRSEEVIFDITKSNSTIYINENVLYPKKYNSPFDVLLQKNFSNAELKKIETLKNNRIMRLHVKTSNGYRFGNYVFQLEFTGRNTNAIILNDKGVVIEALRHIGENMSHRSVKIGKTLKALKEFDFEEKVEKINDVKEFLLNNYAKQAEKKLNIAKDVRLKRVTKKLEILKKKFTNLEKPETLKKKSYDSELKGGLIFANLHKIKIYEKLELIGYDGKSVKIEIPKKIKTPSQLGNDYYRLAKKYKQKAKSLHVEQKSLGDKIEFFEKMKNIVATCKDLSELEILMPLQKRDNKKKTIKGSVEEFFVSGYKIELGKNQKGNAELLKSAKKRNIWLHIKNIASSHVIIRTDKQNVPDEVLKFAARLCVNFSIKSSGTYLVDYTARHNVKITNGANVTYTNYKTLHVKKD